MTVFGQREAAPLYADQFEIYHGNANPDLAHKIARYLGTEPGKAEVFQFANENIFGAATPCDSKNFVHGKFGASLSASAGETGL